MIANMFTQFLYRIYKSVLLVLAHVGVSVPALFSISSDQCVRVLFFFFFLPVGAL